MNSKEKGDIVVGQAIAHYSKKNVQVLIPLGDKKPYDLVIDDGVLKKVQCKYAGTKGRKNGSFRASLRITGGNQSFHTAKPYKEGDFDILFVMSADGKTYEIPSVITNKLKNSITVGGLLYQECLIT